MTEKTIIEQTCTTCTAPRVLSSLPADPTTETFVCIYCGEENPLDERHAKAASGDGGIVGENFGLKTK